MGHRTNAEKEEEMMALADKEAKEARDRIALADKNSGMSKYTWEHPSYDRLLADASKEYSMEELLEALEIGEAITIKRNW